MGTYYGDLVNRGESGTLHSLGIENASMLSTDSKRHFAMLWSFLYRTAKPNIACMLILGNMHWAQCSPRCKIRWRRFWVTSAVSYIMWRADTLYTTTNY
jgi:hypothetical protein